VQLHLDFESEDEKKAPEISRERLIASAVYQLRSRAPATPGGGKEAAKKEIARAEGGRHGLQDWRRTRIAQGLRVWSSMFVGTTITRFVLSKRRALWPPFLV
jgi:hypothetical protein